MCKKPRGLRVYIQRVTVYAGTTRTCSNMCAWCRYTRGRVGIYTREFPACATPHTPHHDHIHNHDHNETPHNNHTTTPTNQSTNQPARTHNKSAAQQHHISVFCSFFPFCLFCLSVFFLSLSLSFILFFCVLHFSKVSCFFLCLCLFSLCSRGFPVKKCHMRFPVSFLVVSAVLLAVSLHFELHIPKSTVANYKNNFFISYSMGLFRARLL